MGYVQANTCGRLHDAREPSVCPLNRGYLYGDAVYEVWRTVGGVIFAWDEHWRRLRASAAALHMELPLARDAMMGEIRRTAAEHRRVTGFAGDVYVRLQVTRGGGPIGLDPALADASDFVVLVQPCPALDPAKRRDGLRLSVANGLRRNPAVALDPAWKTGNYLNNLLCLREASGRGADDVVILNLAGEVAEASASNIAFVRGGALVTPPLAAGILAGVTRGLVLGGVAAEAGIAAAEAPVRPGEFPGMEECLLLSTTKGAAAVAAIDGVRFRVGPDTVASRLAAALDAHSRAYAAAHPELRLLPPP